MRCHRRLLFFALLAVASWADGAELPSEPAHDSPQPRVPAGYTIEVVAEAPLVNHPMMADIDDRGRLFVAESAGTNRRAQELIDEPLDEIRMLEDTDGDGHYDKSTIFADKLTFPQGVLCHEGAVFTCAPPNVWKLEDTDDDGLCDKRTVLVESFGFNGNGASIHGPFRGPDGRLYWCDGRHGHEFFDKSGQLVSQGKAARIFSCKADGSDVRVFCGGGMDNPVEVDWLDSGEMIGTVNLFYGRPRGDVLVHWVEGGVYPRFDQQDCIDEFPWTGGLLPEIHNYGHVAVSGMCRERSPASVGRQPHDTVASFLVTQFNTHKVVRTTLARDGSTFKAITHEDLIVWDNPDVHPTDVLEDADGSILVIDTGGWFRIGCPTSQIAKPEIPGAIYRIRRSDSTDPPQQRQHVESADRLFVPGQFSPGPNELSLLMTTGAPQHRLAAARYLAQQLNDSERTEKLTPDDPLRTQFAQLIVQGLARGEVDRHLAHLLTLSLMRSAAPDVTRAALSHRSATVRRSALIALDQMEEGELTQEEVLLLLDTSDPNLLDAVLDIIGRRDGWVAGTVPLFRSWLTAQQTTPSRVAAMRAFFLAQQEDLWVQELVGDALAHKQTLPGLRRMLVDVVASVDVDPLPPLWVDGLGTTLGLESDPKSRLAAMRTLGSRELSQLDGRLLRIATDVEQPPTARIEAFAAIAPRTLTVPSELFGFLGQQLVGDTDLIEKLTIARSLADAPLDVTRLAALAKAVEAIGPAVIPVLLPAFTKTDDETVGLTLIDGLTALGDSLSLSPDELGQLIKQYPESVRQHAKPLMDQLNVDVAAQAERLDHLLSVVEHGGDVQQGRDVFFSRMAGCSVCHRVGDEGGQVGPALSTIGAIRQPRDLLEAIAFPSASFAREFRPYTILTDEGRVFSGVISARTTERVTLRTADLQEVRIPRQSIDEMQPSQTSIMPKGLDAKLTEAQLRNLIAYLQSLK